MKEKGKNFQLFYCFYQLKYEKYENKYENIKYEKY